MLLSSARHADKLAALLISIAVTMFVSPAGVAGQTSSAEDYITLDTLRARYGQKASRYITIQGTQIHYIAEGTGPALLLLHGSNSSLRTYDIIAARLKKHFRVIRIDMPGMGLSDAPSAQLLDMPLYPVAVAEKLLGRLGVRSAAVGGVSSGGTTAFYLAARRPDLVNRLILSNTPADPVGPGTMTLSPELAATAPKNSNSFAPKAYWRAFFDHYSGDPARISDGKVSEYFDMNRRVPARSRMALVEAMADRANTQAQLARINIPVLLVWGARDPLLTLRFADILAGYISGGQVSRAIMPDVGHYPPLEAPERFAQIVDNYLLAVAPGHHPASRSDAAN